MKIKIKNIKKQNTFPIIYQTIEKRCAIKIDRK